MFFILRIWDLNRFHGAGCWTARRAICNSGKDLPQIFDEYDRLAKEMIQREKEGRGFNFFHFMIDLTGGPCVAKRLSGCGSGTEYLAVTPWGDLYPCHQL